MKNLTRLLPVVLGLCLVLSLSSAASADSDFVAYVDVQQTEDTITVVIPDANNAVLSAKKPTLSIPCGFAAATVEKDLAPIPATMEDGMVSFTVASGGTYIIREAEVSSIFSYAALSVDEDSGVPTAPSEAGPKTLFSGWYADEACTEPLAENADRSEAYAKFIDASVLKIYLRGAGTCVPAPLLRRNRA